MNRSIYITTTRDKFAAEMMHKAFYKYTDSYKMRTWFRSFDDPEKPDEQDIRYYWEFKAMVTKDQEQKLRKVVKDCTFTISMRRRMA